MPTDGSENSAVYQELMATLTWAEKAYAMMSLLYDAIMTETSGGKERDLQPVKNMLDKAPPTLRDNGIIRRMDAEWEAEGL
jgi:hypothetical protein